MSLASHPLHSPVIESITGVHQRALPLWKERAKFKVPSRARAYTPGEAFKAWRPPERIVVPPAEIKAIKSYRFPGFWMWVGNSRLVWFAIEVFPAIGSAWRAAGAKAKATFNLE